MAFSALIKEPMNSIMIKKLLIIVTLILFVEGCYPARKDIDAFKLMFTGHVNTRDIPRFSDCILDGFNSLEGRRMSPRDVRQQQRSTGSRIETLVAAGDILFVSIDIHNDGLVELYETTAAPLNSKEPEHNIFFICLEKYKQL